MPHRCHRQLAPHYLQVTEADFAKAAGNTVEEDGQSEIGESPEIAKNDESKKAQQKAQQQASQPVGTDWQGSEQESENPDDSENRRDSLVISAPPVGLEPTT
jgi:hypothetical protein